MNKIVNIAIVGLGQVGIYLYNELRLKKKEIEIKTGKKINIVAISAKNKNKKRKYNINKKIFYTNPLKILKEKKIDILFESIGQSDGISKKIVMMALKNKINVITPNKALISKHGNELAKLAEKNNVNLEFEASVAGGIPILRTIKEGLATNKIKKVYGILNGTTNYILTEMEKSNETFDKVLKKAQELDDMLQPLHKNLFIESNPSPVKYAASLLKLSPDDVRLPLVKIKDTTKDSVKEALKFAKLI